MTSILERPHCASLKTFRFLVHPEKEAVRIASRAGPPWVQYPGGGAAFGALMRMLLEHPLRTTDPEEACVRVPAVNTMCTSNVCGLMEIASGALARLPLWIGGKDGLLWDFSDHWTQADPGAAMIAKSSFGKPWDVHAAAADGSLSPQIRVGDVPNYMALTPGYDVAAPLTFFRCRKAMFAHLARAVGVKRRPWADRDVLASFSGTLYGFERTDHPAGTRVAMMRAAEAEDAEAWSPPVVLRVACSISAEMCDGTSQKVQTHEDPACERWERQLRQDSDVTLAHGPGPAVAEPGPRSFDGLLRGSRFVLVLPGEGTHSYRLLEAMAAGAVPVLVGGSSAPFADLIDWDAVAFTEQGRSVSDLRLLLRRLAAVGEEEWSRKQRAGASAYSKLLFSPRRHVDTVFITIASRLRRAAVAKGAVLAHSSDSEEASAETLLGRTGWASPPGAEALAALPWRQPGIVAPERWFDRRDGPQTDDSRPVDACEDPGVVPELAWAGSLSAAAEAKAADVDVLPVLRPPTTPVPVRSGSSRALVPESTSLTHLHHQVTWDALTGPCGARLGGARALADAKAAAEVSHVALAEALARAVTVCLPTPAARMGDTVASAVVMTAIADMMVRTGAYRQAAAAAQLAVVFMTDSVQRSSTVPAGPPAMDVHAAVQLLLAVSRRYVAALRQSMIAAGSAGALAGVTGPPVRSAEDAVAALGASAMGLVAPVLPEPMLGMAGQSGPAGWQVAWRSLLGCGEDGRAGPGPAAADAWVDASRSAFTLRRWLERQVADQTLKLEASGHTRKMPAHPELPAATARVALVSMCSYEASATPLTGLSFANKHAYCRRHGYTCLLETVHAPGGRPPAWGKVHYLRKHLQAAEWVAWLDCDSLVTNFSVPLESVLARAGVMGPPEADGQAPAAAGIVMVASEDAASLNTGVFFLRRSPEAAALLDEVWEAGEAYASHSWWEQAAFMDVLAFGKSASTMHGRLVTVPQAAINAYPLATAAKFTTDWRPHHAVWRRGDFIVSFSGCARMLGPGKQCSELIRRFDTEWRAAERADLDSLGEA